VRRGRPEAHLSGRSVGDREHFVNILAARGTSSHFRCVS